MALNMEKPSKHYIWYDTCYCDCTHEIYQQYKEHNKLIIGQC
jgi:hypothetical protein